MSCYQNLVRSTFIAAASQQLHQARTAITADMGMFYQSGVHKFDNEYNKVAYYNIGNVYGFFAELYKPIEKEKIYYLNYKQFTFAFSSKKKVIDAAIQYGYKVNGDVPLFRYKHIINKQTVHTVLFDTNFTVPPSSVN